MSKFTPGLWEKIGCGIVKIDPYTNECVTVARAQKSGKFEHRFNPGESDANAQLISCAPELLAFAEKFLSRLLYTPDNQVVMKFDDLAQLRLDALALIAKAEGRGE